MLANHMISPQSHLAGTQCTQCGYPSCNAYAQALTQGAPTTLCRPGGARVAQALAQALNQPYQPPAQPPLPPQIAFVTEADCIGCTLCLQKCPTAAIVGAPKQLHTVLNDLCTGCNLCVPVCPTQCISLHPAPAEHKLTEQLPNASQTPAAQAATWALVKAAAQRAATPATRTTHTKAQAAPVELNPLQPNLTAKIAAARHKSATKYAAKGPLKTPKALKPNK